MVSTFLFAVTAPAGAVHSCFDLQDDVHDLPEDVTILLGHPPTAALEALILTMTRLSGDVTYRALVAQAATNHAEVMTGPLRLLIRRFSRGN